MNKVYYNNYLERNMSYAEIAEKFSNMDKTLFGQTVEQFIEYLIKNNIIKEGE